MDVVALQGRLHGAHQEAARPVGQKHANEWSFGALNGLVHVAQRNGYWLGAAFRTFADSCLVHGLVDASAAAFCWDAIDQLALAAIAVADRAAAAR